METLIFLIFAALAVASSLVVVAHRSPVYATMSLVVTLFSVAVLFVLLGAPFLGALQILIYAGAIVVLFLFVIMLLNLQKASAAAGRRGGQLWVALPGALLFVGMVGLVFWRAGAPALQPLTADLVSLKGLATALFSDYLLPFEIVGLLLLVAVIGATVAARRAPDGEASRLLPREDFVGAGDEPRKEARS
ncbi:MAG: NADH-quinone oxidoreductase subunit J [Acidobacteria bacterium]|nr:NADH-quinone oxidoreductase subunit J [Acidobacteriota bacterium]